MDNSKHRQNELLGVNKMGKNIKKSPLHQPNFGTNPCIPPLSQPQVYNIDKNDFRDIVQQLTGSSQEPRPPQNSPKPPSMRLQRIRPPPLTPVGQPRRPAPVSMTPAPMIPCNNDLIRPAQYNSGSLWPNTAESPISAYMRYLRNPATDSASKGSQAEAQPVPQAEDPGQTSGLPSPSGYLNLLSPGSPYPLLSPGIQFSPLFTPYLPFSPMALPPPRSPGLVFPLSPSGLFPVLSPRWED